jgi:hypothetical protein
LTVNAGEYEAASNPRAAAGELELELRATACEAIEHAAAREEAGFNMV